VFAVSGNGFEVSWQATQHVRPPRGDHNNFLEPHPELSRQIDPRLHAECHPFFEGEVIRVRHGRRLVLGETDAVASPVDEVRSTSLIGTPGRITASALYTASSTAR